MRSLCLLLILGNVLYFTWAQFIDVDYSRYLQSESTETPGRIALASEAPPSDEPGPPVPQRQPAAQSSSDCVSVGPFSSLPEAARAAATLSAAGFDSKQRVEQGELWAGYWVYVADLGAAGAADAATRRLRENGIEDTYLLPGDNGPVISLGIFVDVDRARRRAEAAQALGLKVSMAERKRTGSVYWIDATPQAAGQALEPTMFLPEPGKIVRIELQPCSARASD
jgi:hypothetical protein